LENAVLNLEFDDDDFEIIEEERIHNPDYRIRQRMQALYMKCLGYSHQCIAELTGLHANTTTQILKTYQDYGLLTVACFHYGDRRLLAPQAQAIEELLEKEPPSSLKEAQKKVLKNQRNPSRPENSLSIS
jgi:transposase